MSYEPIYLAVPAIYAALQLDALFRMEGDFRRKALVPAYAMMAAFTLQLVIGMVDPAVAATVPLVAMTGSVLFLGWLNRRFDRTLHAPDETDEAPEPCEVVDLGDFRT